MPTGEQVESVARVGILAGIGVMAGAASFTHMHDWTMANAPAGTGDWFGWANAMASELTPTVAVLDMRRRRRTGASVRFPAVVLVGFLGLSMAAQFARAKPSVSGWLLAVVPAVAFAVLSKMVLTGGPATKQEPVQDNGTSDPASSASVAASTGDVPAPSLVPSTSLPTPSVGPTRMGPPARPTAPRVVVPSRPISRTSLNGKEVPTA
ncbi:DUF2637 domain-containing protein [Actinocatenispora sera]|uniref:DUF2637 domain-containing protein n=1 Tax=Actinocatenispora sera TaxID=390989 RepID=A0A810L175_9ACTN|nr:DUF2637 domain-containing protein [Actinocatenispora sera]BCJ27958.1 hypothetical protein Asera_20660 [Actinocatenispora sera]